MALPLCAPAEAGRVFHRLRTCRARQHLPEGHREPRGLPLAQEITLREGKFIIGQDIQPGTYTLKCTETFGETYGDAYSSLGGLFGGDLGGMMNSLGGMMGDMINAEAEILGNYGTVLKSYELKTGDSVRITLEEGTALQLSDGAFILIAD